MFLNFNFRVDSSEIAFLQVGEGIMQQVFDRGDKSILEPVMTVEISYPVEFDSRVNMLLADRSVDVTDTETDYLVSSFFYTFYCAPGGCTRCEKLYNSPVLIWSSRLFEIQ